MTIRHLKIFLSVYETGSTIAASKKLHITQPSVSTALSELETYYKIRLFERYAKRLYITDAGREFYQYVRHVVDLFDCMEDSLRKFSITGNLCIGSSITIGNYFLPYYVKEFSKIWPSSRVKVYIDNTESIISYLMDNQIDLALIEGPAHNHFLRSYPYKSDELVVVCSPKHPFSQKHSITPKELADADLMLREPGSAVRELVDTSMKSYGLMIAPLWQSSSTQALIQAVRQNIGVSILPYYLVKEEIRHGTLVRIAVDDMLFTREYHIVFHKNKFHFPAMDDFIELCKNYEEGQTE